jgi:hypothetical protein
MRMKITLQYCKWPLCQWESRRRAHELCDWLVQNRALNQWSVNLQGSSFHQIDFECVFFWWNKLTWQFHRSRKIKVSVFTFVWTINESLRAQNFDSHRKAQTLFRLSRLRCPFPWFAHHTEYAHEKTTSLLAGSCNQQNYSGKCTHSTKVSNRSQWFPVQEAARPIIVSLLNSSSSTKFNRIKWLKYLRIERESRKIDALQRYISVKAGRQWYFSYADAMSQQTEPSEETHDCWTCWD